MCIKVIYDTFPASLQGRVKGLTMATGDGFKIIIDSSRSPQGQRHTLGHELAHISLHHFDRAGVQWERIPGGGMYCQNERIEREANEIAWKCYRRFMQVANREKAATTPGQPFTLTAVF